MNAKVVRIIPAFLVGLLSLQSGFSREPENNKDNSNGSSPNSNLKSLAADCAPPSEATQLDFNNVRALIQTGGDMWWDFNNPRYEVPKNSGNNAIFAGALWMGGQDVNQQLKLAAHTYRGSGGSQVDFWTGPLTTDGTASIGPSTCQKYDQHYRITRAMVEEHVAWAEDPNQYPDYEIPSAIKDWPAHGDLSKGQDFYLAPFYDFDAGMDGGLANATYEPSNGDYPYYDIKEEIDCRKNRVVTLYGDETLWWVFNDKGNVHTETGGDPIGMEVRAQAFAFATNDEVNDMTFYNYELINRGSQTLTQTYFAQFVDADLGFSDDDYVGCDVSRGLGFCYNGDNFDEAGNGAQGYGNNPPAIGVDFFEGPYQDSTGTANDIGIGPNEAVDGNGVGYGDSIVDNERFGMRHFFYYNRGSGPQGDPQSADEYYGYMRGFWRDGTRLTYGGNGYDPSGSNPPADFMFPGDSDPLGWGTPTVSGSLPPWTEVTAGNSPFDRRFLQSAGPFTLKPGDVNDITVGVVYARSFQGDAYESVKKLKTADSKAQSLFDNCFEVLDGPDAPVLEIQELDQELILTLSNPPISNNYLEQYKDKDPFIPDSIEDPSTGNTVAADPFYRFQGYRIYQVKDETVGPASLDDPDLARLVAQVDIKDNVGKIINYNLDEELGAVVPIQRADSVNEGISHSFRVTEDLFAQGNDRLINHRTYHYIAIAYAYNNFKPYIQDDPQYLDGQKHPYLGSRRSADKSGIESVSAIPHIPSPERGGTVQNSEYGDGVELTRIEGRGNGGQVVDLKQSEIDAILQNSTKDHITYEAGKGPVEVKVIDPLNVPAADFELRLKTDTLSSSNLDSAYWTLKNLKTGKVVSSAHTINVRSEEVIPEWGISVTVEQYQGRKKNCGGNGEFVGPLEATLTFDDPQKDWLAGLPDAEGNNALNWIKSGTQTGVPSPCLNDYAGMDDNEVYEGLLQGTWAPFALASFCPNHPASSSSIVGCDNNPFGTRVEIADLRSVDIVFTDDKSKWTRCPVLEMNSSTNLAEGGAEKLELREQPSVDKDGNPDGSGKKGMGWFPGYAVDVETGERLNMAFGEDSWYAAENGADMMWNPTSRMFTNFGLDTLFGGKHYVYVFAATSQVSNASNEMPAYDQGQFLYNYLQGGLQPQDRVKVWGQCIWVGTPILNSTEHELLSTDAKIRLRVGKKYEKFQTGNDNRNNFNPMYTFSTTNLATETKSTEILKQEVLDTINVVPNPYYAYSYYESSKLDNRIKIINLPEECTVKIYNVSGTLIRTLEKDNPLTELEWDLKNEANIPIAGGTYLIHVKVPDVGETTLKWFGAMRPTDLENF